MTDDTSRTIGLTLVRAFEVALTTVAWRWERHPEMKGSQVLGEHAVPLFHLPACGRLGRGAASPGRPTGSCVPLEPVQAGRHAGHAAPVPEFPRTGAGRAACLSCLKQIGGPASRSVVRIYNPTSRGSPGSLTLFQAAAFRPILEPERRTDRRRDPEVDGNTDRLPVGAKKIVTLELILMRLSLGAKIMHNPRVHR